MLENPDNISKTVLAKGLDAGTAFEILSIDIADVDVGENIGATLQAHQAEADKARFQLKLKNAERWLLPKKLNTEQKSKRTKRSLSSLKPEVPIAMAEAFRQGNFGVMDYYNMKNVVSDTNMRSSIAGETPEA